MALQLSTRGRYGVRLMVALALNHRAHPADGDGGKGVSLLREIARSEGISEKYLGQIMIPLRASGLVASHRGAHGGYSLARPPEDITVRDVLEAIEGTLAPVPCEDPAAGASQAECGESGDGCDRPTACVVTRVWRALHEQVVGALSSVSLKKLADEARELGQPADDYVI